MFSYMSMYTSRLQAVEFTVIFFFNAPNLRSGVDFISVTNAKHL
ncbi:unnamed protein product [Staurois parvus]|uniref:Uncharacterized protein n=1 Tax=Staurois parvus TaxID=386267 RepID=A0ABN9FGU0_9NEOB|nr:unnamed protein product [Staurois parvus]